MPNFFKYVMILSFVLLTSCSEVNSSNKTDETSISITETEEFFDADSDEYLKKEYNKFNDIAEEYKNKKLVYVVKEESKNTYLAYYK